VALSKKGGCSCQANSNIHPSTIKKRGSLTNPSVLIYRELLNFSKLGSSVFRSSFWCCIHINRFVWSITYNKKAFFVYTLADKIVLNFLCSLHRKFLI